MATFDALALASKKPPSTMNMLFATGVAAAADGSLASLLPAGPDLEKFSREMGRASQEMLAGVLRVACEQLAVHGFSHSRTNAVIAYVEGKGAKVETSCVVTDVACDVTLDVLVVVHAYPSRAATLLPMTRTRVTLHVGRPTLIPRDGSLPVGSKGVSGCVLSDVFVTEEAIDDSDPLRYIQSALQQCRAEGNGSVLLTSCSLTAAEVASQLEP